MASLCPSKPSLSTTGSGWSGTDDAGDDTVDRVATDRSSSQMGPDRSWACVYGEMALHVLAYNLTRVMNIIGIKPLVAAIGG
jgi:hypothetical protein